MFEQSVLSIWSSMNSWLTPTVLFLLLNLMIGTIAFASTLGSQKHQTQQDQQHHQGLVRSNSVLQRFKSINFYSYKSEDRHEAAEETKLVRSPSILQRLKSEFHFHYPQQPDQSPQTEIGHNNPPETELVEPDQFDSQDQTQQQTLDEVYSKLHERHVSRTTSDTKPAPSGEVVNKLPRKMKKSASAKSAFAHSEAEEVERRRPATVREAEQQQHRHEEDEEVDAKADDFINRFKQQLKLQRIDSIIRYKEMITNRGNDGK